MHLFSFTSNLVIICVDHKRRTLRPQAIRGIAL